MVSAHSHYMSVKASLDGTAFFGPNATHHSHHHHLHPHNLTGNASHPLADKLEGLPYGDEYSDLAAFAPAGILLLLTLLPFAVQVSSLMAENAVVTVLVMMMLKFHVENFVTVFTHEEESPFNSSPNSHT